MGEEKTALGLPREIGVRLDPRGNPVAVERRQVSCLLNTWRIDDEWWREEISRQYYQLLLGDGSTMTVFHDLLSGRWYRQRC